MNGLSLKYSDRLMLPLFKLLVYFCTKKISRYKTVHLFNYGYKFLSEKQVLHIDDPNYTQIEILNLNKWEKFCTSRGITSIIICTNSYTYKWLTENLLITKVFIIEQGFHSIEIHDNNPKKMFSCVYTSPYIHYGKDKHAKHSTWGSEILINEIIPRLNILDPEIHFVLIGEIGDNAQIQLAKLKNVHSYGRVNFIENIKLLTTCSIGIYPRQYDHKRSILKIFSYIGAGLPIVTFDLIDTEVVKANSLGFSVDTINEFVTRIVELKASPKLMQMYMENVGRIRMNYTWPKLAEKMEIKLSEV